MKTQILTGWYRTTLALGLSLGALLASGPASGQAPSQSEAQAVVAAKRDRLNQLASGRVVLEAGQLREVLDEALTDRDPSVRKSALWAVAGRAGGVRFSDTSERLEQWRAERPVLVSVRPMVLLALKDPDPELRLAAVGALGSLEFELGGPPIGLLRNNNSDLIQHFSDLFHSEPSAAVRGEIAKSFALGTADSPAVHDLLFKAAKDSAAGVRQAAARGLGRIRRAEALRVIIELMSDPVHQVRLVAAQAVAQHELDAVPYLPKLRELLASEPDDLVQKALQGSMGLLEKVAAGR